MSQTDFLFTCKIRDLALDAAKELDRISRGEYDTDLTSTTELLTMFRNLWAEKGENQGFSTGGWAMAYSAYTAAIDPNLLQKTRTVSGFYDLFGAWLSRCEKIVANRGPEESMRLMDKVLALHLWALKAEDPVRLNFQS